MIHVNDTWLHFVGEFIRCMGFLILSVMFRDLRKRSDYPVACTALTWIFGTAFVATVGRVVYLLTRVGWFMPYVEVCGAGVMIVCVRAIYYDVRKRSFLRR